MNAFHYEHLQFNDVASPYIFHRGCKADKTHGFPAHWHESIELLYFYEGECDVVADTQHIHVYPGDIVVINSEKIHYITTNQLTCYNALIIPPAFLQKCGIDISTALVPYISHTKETTTASLYRKVTQEDKEKRPYYQSACKAAVTSLVIHLYRHYSTDSKNIFSVTGAKARLVKESLDFIRRHYLENISTADISRHLGVTVNHFCACFKEVTGVTLKKYINSLRCHDAENMLSSGQYSVTETATQCGFDNMAYFAKTYRSVIKVNPSETLAQAKKKRHPL